MMNYADDILAHHGTKGMKWGVRKDDHPGASRSTNREAKKDAGEFARAKMYYGEGAGTRRKLIKATVEAKSKKDSQYKAAFDHHLSNQDLGSHASKARKERRRTDTKNTTVKTAKGVHRSLTGGFGNVSLAAAVIAGGYTVAKQTGADQVVKNAASTKVSDMRMQAQARQHGREFLKKQGL